jgi:hypothetical protein
MGDYPDAFSEIDKTKFFEQHSTWYGGEPWLITDDEVKAVLKTTYDQTQAKFKEWGYKPDDTITLFRGHDPSTQYKPFIPGKVWGKLPIECNYKGNAIESWSVSMDSASVFGREIATAKVPVKSIFSTCITGQGCLVEGELLVFGSLPNHKALIQNKHDNSVFMSIEADWTIEPEPMPYIYEPE